MAASKWVRYIAVTAVFWKKVLNEREVSASSVMALVDGFAFTSPSNNSKLETFTKRS